MRFSVGQRVRVVSDEFDEDFVGAVGRIVEIYDDDEVDYPYIVEFDHPIDGEDNRSFGEDEIVALNVKVIEGLAEETTEGIAVGGMALKYELSEGKRYRVTIEEVEA